MLQFNRSQLPRHVAIIMDGNGRWASRKLRRRIFGHEEGVNSVREVMRCCRKFGIPYLTLYAFSKENWQRPEPEVVALWDLLKRFVRSELPELMEEGVQLRHLGDVEGIPEDALRELQSAVAQTAKNDKLVVNLALNYGGRQEIARAARLFAADVEKGKHRLNDLTPELFSKYLFTVDCPDPELIIRTGGEYRVSNFLLWQLAYAELYITDTFWPEFREAQFIEALDDYLHRERRFGKTSEQVRKDNSSAMAQRLEIIK
jgi:undecaprenyl diphosphate synthase